MAVIAVIDDSGIDRTFARACLQKRRHDVRQLLPVDLPYVIEQLEQIRPDLILLDFKIPGCPGATIARTCRAMPALRAIPIVLHTAHCDPASREEYEALGIERILLKPCSPDRLAATVEAVLAARRPRALPGS